MAARLRVLLDACVTQKLRNDLTGHDVETARYAGSADVDDRALLDAMAGRFDVLVTHGEVRVVTTPTPEHGH